LRRLPGAGEVRTHTDDRATRRTCGASKSTPSGLPICAV